MGKSPGKSVSLLGHGPGAMQNKESSNKLFAKMGNDIINGSVEKTKENNFMAAPTKSVYNSDSKKIQLSDNKGLMIKPQELNI